MFRNVSFSKCFSRRPKCNLMFAFSIFKYFIKLGFEVLYPVIPALNATTDIEQTAANKHKGSWITYQFY